MSYETLKENLRDVAFTTAAPFSEDGEEMLYDELERNTRAVMDAGGRVFIPCGNTGEYYSLSEEERIGMVRTTVETVGDAGTIIGGVGGSTKAAQQRIDAYADAGADAVMVMHPSHTYIHERGLIEYYRKLADHTDLGIVLYKRGPELSLSVLDALSTIDNVVAVKFAVNDIASFSKAVRTTSGDLVFSTGIAERFAPAFALEGAEGFTTGIGAFVPEVAVALMEALREKDWERAMRIRDLVRPYEDLREEPGPDNDLVAANNVPAIKFGIELAGRYGGPVREPIVELSEENKHRAEDYYDQITSADI